MSALPAVTYIVLACDKGAWFNADDPSLTMDDAADAVAETLKHWGDIPVRVLRISETLNTDDVTADAFDLIAKRMKGRAA
jgi:hypothetical protein